MGTRTRDFSSEGKTRLQSALAALLQSESAGTSGVAAARQALLCDLAGAMQDYLTELGRLGADAPIRFTPSRRFRQLMQPEKHTRTNNPAKIRRLRINHG